MDIHLKSKSAASIAAVVHPSITESSEKEK